MQHITFYIQPAAFMVEHVDVSTDEANSCGQFLDRVDSSLE